MSGFWSGNWVSEFWCGIKKARDRNHAVQKPVPTVIAFKLCTKCTKNWIIEYFEKWFSFPPLWSREWKHYYLNYKISKNNNSSRKLSRFFIWSSLDWPCLFDRQKIAETLFIFSIIFIAIFVNIMIMSSLHDKWKTPMFWHNITLWQLHHR